MYTFSHFPIIYKTIVTNTQALTGCVKKVELTMLTILY